MTLDDNLEIVNEINNNDEIDNYIHYDIITLLLKGYFINMNIKNIEELVNKIWNYEKPLQTFETLTEEILILIDNYINDSNSTFNNDHNRNIIMNYFFLGKRSFQNTNLITFSGGSYKEEFKF